MLFDCLVRVSAHVWRLLDSCLQVMYATASMADKQKGVEIARLEVPLIQVTHTLSRHTHKLPRQS